MKLFHIALCLLYFYSTHLNYKVVLKFMRPSFDSIAIFWIQCFIIPVNANLRAEEEKNDLYYWLHDTMIRIKVI